MGLWIFYAPKDTKQSLVSCEACNKRNAAAAMRCWNCDEPMTKLCPACLESVAKGTLDCPHCTHDMRVGERGSAPGAKLLDTPSGAALISAYRPGVERAGGWLPVQKVWDGARGILIQTEANGAFDVPEALRPLAKDARWIRCDEAGMLAGLLVPNGLNRTSVRMYGLDGSMLIVPMPQAAA